MVWRDGKKQSVDVLFFVLIQITKGKGGAIITLPVTFLKIRILLHSWALELNTGCIFTTECFTAMYFLFKHRQQIPMADSLINLPFWKHGTITWGVIEIYSKEWSHIISVGNFIAQYMRISFYQCTENYSMSLNNIPTLFTSEHAYSAPN